MSAAFGIPDEEDVAGAAPGVAAAVQPPPVQGMPAMPGVPPGAAPPIPGASGPVGVPGAPPPDQNAALGPEDLMQPGADLAPQPGQPGAPPAPIATLPNGQIDTAAEEKKTLEQQPGLDQAAIDAEAAKGKANVGAAAAESQGADAAAQIEAQYAAKQAQALDAANTKTQGWIDKAQTDQAAYQKMGLHDYWADKSTGSKVLAGIAMAFGGANGSQNPGLAIINNAIERDFRMQQANIEKARSNVEGDRQMYELGMSAKQSALADNNLKKAGALDAAAAQLQSYKMKQGVPLAQAQTDANVVALRQKANTTRMETLQAVHKQNVEDAQLGINQEKADALKLRAEKYKTHTGGGGGSAADPQGLAQAIRVGVDDGKGGKRPMTYDEQLAAAKQFGVPPEAKAGRVSLTSVLKGAAFDANQSAKEAKAGTGTDPNSKNLPIRDGSGQIRGYVAPQQARQVKQIQDRSINYDQAIKSLEDILKDKSLLSAVPSGSKWNNAVLAIASTTTAGQTDANVAHEAGTLKDRAGRVDPEAVRAKLEDLRTRQQGFYNQLIPVTGTKGTAGGTVTATSGGVTPQQRDRAKAVLADPVAKAKLNDKQLAIVTRAAMSQ